jgi:transcriptional regulator with XRE-family HTH domain
MPAARQAKIAARTQELIAEEMTLRDLRKAQKLTQGQMAAVLKIGQDSVSRIEKRSDLMLSTMRSYVEAMGGSLDLVVRFADRGPVVLSSLGRSGAKVRKLLPRNNASPSLFVSAVPATTRAGSQAARVQHSSIHACRASGDVRCQTARAY